MNYIRDLQLQTHLNVVHSQLHLEACHCVKLFYLNIAIKTLRECIFSSIDAPFHCRIRRAFQTTIYTSTNTGAKSIHHDSCTVGELSVTMKTLTAETNKRGTGTFTFELLPEHKNTRSMACSYSRPGLAKSSKSGTG